MSKTPDSPSVLTSESTPEITVEGLQSMDESVLRSFTQDLLKRVQTQATELQLRQSQIDKLTHEIALLRHLRFAAKTEAGNAQQRSLFEEANAEDLGAAEKKLSELGACSPPTTHKQHPVRQTLPKEFTLNNSVFKPNHHNPTSLLTEFRLTALANPAQIGRKKAAAF